MLQFNYFLSFSIFFTAEVLLFIAKITIALKIAVSDFLFKGLNYFTFFKLYGLNFFFATLAI